VPVLVDEVVEALAIARGETLVDGTFGAGGYTRAMLAAGAGRVIGFDRDPDAIAQGPTLVPDANLTLVEERFSQMDRVLAERGIGLVDGIALDIGVSSMQLDQAERGFSFQADGPLDMRMSKSGLTAAEFLNEARSRAPAPSPAPSPPPARSSGPPSSPPSSAAPPASGLGSGPIPRRAPSRRSASI
jgi:16S rRNA (cytosine1402-N4)-methyltransferase